MLDRAADVQHRGLLFRARAGEGAGCGCLGDNVQAVPVAKDEVDVAVILGPKELTDVVPRKTWRSNGRRRDGRVAGAGRLIR